MEDRLEPCPRCGGQVVLVDAPRDTHVIWCMECDEVSYPPRNTAGNLAESWNGHRPEWSNVV